ncbi:hypothetical protein L2E82_31626 [Cichorium intybus]|uniref:Uncharacterized protein n=1 Tax=Cichorium intybus TaxID=13427 RepID=A0ACB9BEK0_CICIN|nr:hypothetical protein L2E82_31626 [Cichorium intybus]
MTTPHFLSTNSSLRIGVYASVRLIWKISITYSENLEVLLLRTTSLPVLRIRRAKRVVKKKKWLIYGPHFAGVPLMTSIVIKIGFLSRTLLHV